MGEGEKAEVGEWMELEEEGRTKVCGPKGRGSWGCGAGGDARGPRGERL